METHIAAKTMKDKRRRKRGGEIEKKRSKRGVEKGVLCDLNVCPSSSIHSGGNNTTTSLILPQQVHSCK